MPSARRMSLKRRWRRGGFGGCTNWGPEKVGALLIEWNMNGILMMVPGST